MSPPRPPGGGYALVPGTIGEIARRLDAAGQGVDATASGAPAAPDAGDSTAAVAEALGFLADSLAGVAEGLDAAAEAAVNSEDIYERAEQASTVQPCRADDWSR
jgi:hypothetical protein